MSDAPVVPSHEEGLKQILEIVQTKATASSDHACVKSFEAPEPVRLLASTPLSLVAVVDFETVSKQIGDEPVTDDMPKTTDAVDAIARGLRFAINDADTAQALIIVLAAPREHFRAVAKHVFGPDVSRGEQVLRVVPTGPVDDDEADAPGSHETWMNSIALDLEVTDQALPTGIGPLGTTSARDMSEEAGNVAKEILMRGIPERGDEEATAFAGHVAESVRDAFQHREADVASSSVAHELMLSLLDTFSRRRPSENGGCSL